MIAVKCEHCGQRMTPQKDGETAHCPSCNKTIPSRPGLRRPTNSGTARALSATPPPERETHNAAIHEIVTRVEPVQPRRVNEHTVFLRPPEQPDEIGRLGGYRVLEVIGSGGMGVVFRAEEIALERQVALKAMLPALAAHPVAKERFLREARAAAKLQHDRIVAIYQVGEDRDVPFLAMPFLRGESLETRLARKAPMPEDELRRIGRELAEGLSAIHERGLIHRDVKPGNVWLEGEAGRVKVLDFGLARARGDVQLTQEGSIVGSPAFMAPEQALRKPLDARADLFSLGCVLYAMATGRLPFEGDDALTTLFAVANDDPTPPADLNPELSAGLAALIGRLLAKRPDDRPASAREVMAAL